MSLGNAIQFVRKAPYDKELRARCHEIPSKDKLYEMLDFNEVEFEDAINMQLVKCQTYEEAEIVNEIKIWFSLL